MRVLIWNRESAQGPHLPQKSTEPVSISGGLSLTRPASAHPKNSFASGKFAGVVIIADAVVVFIALGLTYFVRFGQSFDEVTAGKVTIPYPVVTALVWAVWMLFLCLGTKPQSPLHSAREEIPLLIRASLTAFGAIAIGSYLSALELSRAYLIVSLPVGLLLLIVSRSGIRQLIALARKHGRGLQSTLVVGLDEDVRGIVRNLRRFPEGGLRPDAVCVCDSEGFVLSSFVPGQDGGNLVPAGIHCSELTQYVNDQAYSVVIVASTIGPVAMRDLRWSLEWTRAQLLLAPGLSLVGRARLSVVSASWMSFLRVDPAEFIGVKYMLKRSFDILFSSMALVFLAPLFAILFVLIKAEDPGPVIFRQTRIGQYGKPFTIHKLRSMYVDSELKLETLREHSFAAGPLFKLKEDPRITRIGKVLRRYSLDELPQFWTVLRGSMSVVGPRPHLLSELESFPEEGLRRLYIKPGITGLWQVNGRSDLSFEDSVQLDLLYAENWTLAGDLSVVSRTVKSMVSPTGAY